MIERIEITDGTKLISHRAREVSPVTFLIWVSTESAKYFKDCFCEWIWPLCHIGNCSKEAIVQFLKEVPAPKLVWSSRLLRKETTLEDLLNPERFKILVQEAQNPLRVDDEWCIDCEPEPGSKLTSAVMNKSMEEKDAMTLIENVSNITFKGYAMPSNGVRHSPYWILTSMAILENTITQNSYGWKSKVDIRSYAGIPGLMVKPDRPEYSLTAGLKRMPGYKKYMIYPTLGGDAVIATMKPEQVKAGWTAIAQQVLDWKKQYEWV